MLYESMVPYVAEQIHAAAIYCSDGRVGEQFDDFLQNGLKLPRYDRVALPGGPASLVGHAQAHLEEQGVVDELKFLVDAHQLQRVILIAHQGCAFYAQRLQLSPDHMLSQQKMDLVKAADFVRRITGIQQVDGYFAHLQTDRIVFERIPTG